MSETTVEPGCSAELDLDIAAFLADLRELRVTAGAPTYATLARRTGLPRSTLYDGLRRKRLPSLELALALVSALDGDTACWQQRWTSLRSRLDAPPPPIEPASFEPASFEPASFEPASFEPASFEPAPVEPVDPGWYHKPNRWVIGAAAAATVAAAASAATYFVTGPAPGCQPSTLYRVTATGSLLDASSHKVGVISAGELFVVHKRTTGPFRSRLLGTVESTGEAGYVDQAKLDRLRETCS